MSDEPNEKNHKHFSMTYSLDRGDYLRRACPSCGRHFKTKASAADLVAAFRPAFREQGYEIGADSSKDASSGTEQNSVQLCCPYCGYSASPKDMHTSELAAYAKRYVLREVVQPQLNKMFSDMEDSFRGSGSGGFLSVSVKFEHHKEVLPPRPISGPEPPDMQVVQLLCCGRQIKILGSWKDLITCPYCGSICQLQ